MEKFHQLNPEQSHLLAELRAKALAGIDPAMISTSDEAAAQLRNTLAEMELDIEDEHTLYAVTISGIAIAARIRKLLDAGFTPQQAEATQLLGLAGLQVREDIPAPEL